MTNLARLYREGALPEEILSEVCRRLAECDDPSVWISRVPPESLQTQARKLEQRCSTGEVLCLYGVPFAVKDNIDVAGWPTTAGCQGFAYSPAQTAPVVQRLLDAGAIFVGKTNLDQFAAGLAGDRSSYGACRNAFDPTRISGGSSSGSAVAVARGLVSFALGTDTAGSGRVPAGCNNIVGWKPTPGLLDTEGIVPASESLDCVSVFGLTAGDIRQIGAVAAGKNWDGAAAAMPDNFAFATPGNAHLEFFSDQAQAQMFADSLRHIEKMGGRRVEIDYRPFREVAALLYEGPWLAERLAGLRTFFDQRPADIHPVTREVIAAGARYSATDFFLAQSRLRKLRVTCAEIFASADVFAVPTMPTIPTLAEVQANSREWSRRLGYYTNFVNLLGWSALAMPAGFTPRGLPGGVTFIGPAGSEGKLGELGQRWERHLGLPMGATNCPLPALGCQADAPPTAPPGWVRVSVAGAHLRGQPLHSALLQMGARFVRVARTAAKYRFLAFLDLKPPRPGLLRDEARGGATALEIFELPFEGFGKLVASVAPPLAIGTVELEDGESVKGFLCESWAAATARDITEFGGWLAFLSHQAKEARP